MINTTNFEVGKLSYYEEIVRTLQRYLPIQSEVNGDANN